MNALANRVRDLRLAADDLTVDATAEKTNAAAAAYLIVARSLIHLAEMELASPRPQPQIPNGLAEIVALDSEQFCARLNSRRDGDEQAKLLSIVSGLFAGLDEARLAGLAGLAEAFGYFERNVTRAMAESRLAACARDMRDALVALVVVSPPGVAADHARALLALTQSDEESTRADMVSGDGETSVRASSPSLVDEAS